jgi:hypothetical protein
MNERIRRKGKFETRKSKLVVMTGSPGIPMIEGSDFMVGEIRVSIFEFLHLDSR